MTLATLLSADPFVKANRLRPLAITSPRRSARMPSVPTVAELGYEGYDIALWYAIVVPAHTPPVVVSRLNAALREVAKDPVFRARMAASDAEVLVCSPQESAEFLMRERLKWSGPAKSAKVQLEE